MMEAVISNGDYLLDGNGTRRADGVEAILCRVRFRLQARRGSFPFLPTLGSELYRLGAIPRRERLQAARQFVTDALADEPVSVQNVTLTEDGGVLVLNAELRYNGETASLAMTIGGENG